MATPAPLSFAPGEYVKRWLSGTQEDGGLEYTVQKTSSASNAGAPRPESAQERQTIKKQKRRSNNVDEPPCLKKTQHRYEDWHHRHRHSVKQEKNAIDDAPAPSTRKPAVLVDLNAKNSNGYSRNEFHPNTAEPSRPLPDQPCQAGSLGTDGELGVTGNPGERPLRPQRDEENDPTEKYARRQRYKIKADKYEYKGHESSKEQVSEAIATRKPRRARRKKSGIALNHDFRAPNVSQERITLKSNFGPGLFNKSRVSEPAISRGLPDLSFSEMTFLKKRRRQDDIHFQSVRETRSTKDRNKGSAQEISHFFSKPPVNNFSPQKSVVLEKFSSGAKNSLSRSLSSPVKLDGLRYAASITSGNASAARVASNYSQGRHKSRKYWKADGKMAAVEHYKTRSHSVSSRSGNQGVTTSGVSWSITPAHSTKKTTNLLAELRAPSSHVDVKSTPHHLSPAESHRDRKLTNDTIYESSITDQSLDLYTKNVLLQHNSKALSTSPKTFLGARLYFLADLKGLARIAELEESDGKSIEFPLVANDDLGQPFAGQSAVSLNVHQDSRDQPGQQTSEEATPTGVEPGNSVFPTQYQTSEGLAGNSRRVLNTESFPVREPLRITRPQIARSEAVAKSMFPHSQRNSPTLRSLYEKLPFSVSHAARPTSFPSMSPMLPTSGRLAPIYAAQFHQSTNTVAASYGNGNARGRRLVPENNEEIARYLEIGDNHPPLSAREEYDNAALFSKPSQLQTSIADLDEFDADLIGQKRMNEYWHDRGAGYAQDSLGQPSILHFSQGQSENDHHTIEQQKAYEKDYQHYQTNFRQFNRQMDPGQEFNTSNGEEGFGRLRTFNPYDDEPQEEFLGFSRPHLLY